MKIYIENQTLEYENKKEEVDKILNEIDNIIGQSSKVISYMIIDDLEVYEDYYKYLLNNIRTIKKIEVVSNTYQELVNEILISTWKYIERIPAKIEELANHFYRNPQKQDWTDLNDFLGGISWIMSTFSTIDQDIRLKDIVFSYETWNLYAQEIFTLNEILPDFEEALSSSDYVSIADLLSYEILPTLNTMGESLLGLVNVEGSIDAPN